LCHPFVLLTVPQNGTVVNLGLIQSFEVVSDDGHARFDFDQKKIWRIGEDQINLRSLSICWLPVKMKRPGLPASSTIG
jgi:hypothetical protein